MPLHRALRHKFLLIVLLFPCELLFATKVLTLPSSQQPYNCTNYLYFIKEKTTKLSIDDVVYQAQDWQEQDNNYVNFGYTASSWFRLDVENTSDSTSLRYLMFDFPPIDSIILYEPLPAGGFKQSYSGDLVPLSQREVKYRSPVFKVMVTKGRHSYYFHFIALGSTNFRLYTFSEEGFPTYKETEIPFLWMFYGFLIGLFLINLAIFILTRERTYAFFLMFVLSLAFYDFVYNGFAGQYLWPNSPTLSNTLNSFSLSMTLLSITFFLNFFLDIKKNARIFHWIGMAFFAFPLSLLCVASLAGASFRIVTLLNIIILLTLIFTYEGLFIYLSVFKKIKSARFALLGITAFFLLNIFPVFINLGIVPVESTFRWMLEIGHVFTVTMFAFAISDKINLLKNDIQRSQTNLAEKNLELLSSKEKAEESDQLKTYFLTNLNHEVRTPMNSIVGFTDILLEKVEDDEQRTYVQAIKTSSKNLLELITNILDLSQLEVGNFELVKHRTSSTELFDFIRDEYESKALKKGLLFVLEIDSNIPEYILADDKKIKTILDNLVSNAIKFTMYGSVVVTAKVKNLRKEYSQRYFDLHIKVKDTGIGISEQFQSSLFKPFTQQDGRLTRRFEGTGIGLAITSKLVEIMNGIISFSSEVNKGSTFTVILPDLKIIEN